MDYDTIELLAGAVLAIFPVLVLVFIGLWCLKNARARMPIYFFAGLLGALAYGWVAPQLALGVLPPPYDASFASGSGLDLRGLILAFGIMVGCAAGLITTIVFCVLSLIPQFRRKGSNVAGGGSNSGGSGRPVGSGRVGTTSGASAVRAPRKAG